MKKLKQLHDDVINEATEQRFVVQMEFYIWAKNEQDARRQAETIAKRRRDQFDDQAEITDLRSMPFGTMK